jgi:hypothetical protein
MRSSTSMSRFRRFVEPKRLLHAAVLLHAIAAPLLAQADIVRVRESTFNAFVNRLQPIPITGRYAFRVTIDAGPFGRHTITLCDSAYSGVVQNLRFIIQPNTVQVVGETVFSWCNLGFTGGVSATGNISFRSSDDTVRLTFSSARVRPSFRLFGNNVALPVTIDIAQTLNIPPLPIRPALVGFQTRNGAHYLVMEPQDVQLVKHAGFVELETNVVFR